jgi:O-antigen/teichoic acid export membrane protein
MDKIMLGTMTNNMEVGYYESSEKIIKIPISFVTSLGTVMLPRMSNIYATTNNEKYAFSIIEKSLLFAVFLSSLLGFGLMTVSKQFVPFFYGPGFEKCVNLFLILLPSCLFMAIANVVRTQYLIPKQLDNIYLVSVVVGAGANLLFNWIFIPVLQSLGAAIGTLIAEASVCIVQCWSIRKFVSIGKSVLRCFPFVFSGSISFTTLFLCEFENINAMTTIIFKVFLFGMLYFILLFAIIKIVNYFAPHTYDFDFFAMKFKR